jgi:hypothetical protein
MTRGTYIKPLRSLQKNVLAAALWRRRCARVSTTWAVLSDRAPQVMALTLDRQNDRVETPFLPRLRPSVSPLIGMRLARRAAPRLDGFIGHHDATGAQELFHVTGTETAAEVQPDARTDAVDGKAMRLVMGREGWWVHGTNSAHQTAVVQARCSVDQATYSHQGQTPSLSPLAASS